ncbi:MAG: transcription antitermination factor NusB [Vallitaleaceae bacterium]|jgi:N utilization substance protein B|nr:transcription antitermination factor NusB [Vallitaleaceae bacterium]
MNRRKIREHIFRMIFTIEFDAFGTLDEFDMAIKKYIDELGQNEETTLYMYQKTMKIMNHVTDIDVKLNEYADNWSTDRIAKIELAILRLAVYEMLFDDEIPSPVAINEAVELSKKYGSEQSFTFVNGLLAKLI